MHGQAQVGAISKKKATSVPTNFPWSNHTGEQWGEAARSDRMTLLLHINAPCHFQTYNSAQPHAYPRPSAVATDGAAVVNCISKRHQNPLGGVGEFLNMS